MLLELQPPAMYRYGRLRRDAFIHHQELQTLLEPRPPPSEVKPLEHRRAWLLGCSLLCFDFNYGDLIRWLGGEYTNAHRDWDALSDIIEPVRDTEPPPG